MTHASGGRSPVWDPPVPVAVVGCGAVTTRYYVPVLKHLHAHGWVSSVRVFDPVVERARLVAAEVPATTVADTWADVVAADDELVIVASPPSAHAGQIRELLAGGKHVLCEKPFTLEADSARDLAEQASAADRVLAVGMVRRFSRTAGFLQSVLGDPSGGPGTLTWHEGHRFRWPVQSVAYFTSDPGSRLLWDIGSHVVDLVVSWLGVPAAVRCRDDAMGGTETNCLLHLEYANGWTARIRLSRDAHLSQGLVVERGHDVLRCPDVVGDGISWGRRGTPYDLRGALDLRTPGDAVGTPRPSATGFLECFLAQLHNVLDSVRGAAQLAVPAHSVVDGIRCLEDGDRNRQLLEAPWMTCEELARARELHAAARSAGA